MQMEGDKHKTKTQSSYPLTSAGRLESREAIRESSASYPREKRNKMIGVPFHFPSRFACDSLEAEIKMDEREQKKKIHRESLQHRSPLRCRVESSSSLSAIKTSSSHHTSRSNDVTQERMKIGCWTYRQSSTFDRLAASQPAAVENDDGWMDGMDGAGHHTAAGPLHLETSAAAASHKRDEQEEKKKRRPLCPVLIAARHTKQSRDGLVRGSIASTHHKTRKLFSLPPEGEKGGKRRRQRQIQWGGTTFDLILSSFVRLTAGGLREREEEEECNNNSHSIKSSDKDTAKATTHRITRSGKQPPTA
ncbi:hypothetical protein DAPPUDRAFT_304372 [Daphnia pulex]|uniref:Uncharacterized protein n=1 Tax=Daphnia pulex TaxID=6669 RepID=E9GL59_DAPPU|nr:hypothetical protein DAPPUDRAFT_304372 [Daphnia pulex]|eukprot:EFX79847.1 hypothetical protein DAPPUDRAFT_304372 [Daphnia pulex]